MVVYRGTHGTCYEWACRIREEGFKPSTGGRAGPGVYFWTYDSDPAMARELAVGWAKAAHKRNVYAPERSNACGVIFTEYPVEEDECLDCTTRQFEESLNQLLQVIAQNSASIEHHDLESAYQTLIKTTEEEGDVKFKVVLLRVPLPKGMAFKQRIFVGNPAVHLVRAEHEKIAITEFEQVPLAA